MGVLASVGLALLTLSGCTEPPSPQEVIRPIRAMRIVHSETFQGRAFPCRAMAVQDVNVAFEVPGRLIERPVGVGSEVTAGTLLARLDPANFRNALTQAQARAQRARSQRDRIAQALQTRAVAEQDLIDAQAELDAAEAEVEIRAKALEDTKLRAPFDGIISATFVENFQNVQAKQPIMRLLDISSIEAVVNIPENFISAVPYVEDVQVVFDAFPDRVISAAIVEVGREASETIRTFPITLRMDQPSDVDILPGMAGRATVRVALPDEADEAGYDIPLNAVFSDDGQRSLVWVIDPETGTAQTREVEEVGLTPLGVRVVGVTSGEWIATTAVHVLREGQRVRILPLAQEGP